MRLVAHGRAAHKHAVAELFDMRARALRRDRAEAQPISFLHQRVFDDIVERIELVGRRFERALLIGYRDPEWVQTLHGFVERVDVADPDLIEDAWDPPHDAFDLAISVGTLDTVNELPLALRLIRHAMQGDGLFIGAVSGGDTLPQLRTAMRAVDTIAGAAAPHVHPRIDASALAPLLDAAGFVNPVVDVDRVGVSYRSLERLVGDLRGMAATNILHGRRRFIGKAARAAAIQAFANLGDGSRTVETFEILHFAAWTQVDG
jgi:hypothetical protein